MEIHSSPGAKGSFEKDSISLGHAEPPKFECMKHLYGNSIQLEGLHPFADTLISYPTKWYDDAARCGDTGSPYINILVEKLERHGTKESIQEVLHRVHYNTNMLQMKMKEGVKPHRQAPYFESSLQKKFMFPRQ
ncbi:hypothetical protein GWK47_035978 [Chionoecetes opilio]|uniref:Caspase family p10 domain-containing protein n=1 Tax=Chionoecetes opilio TaxID=41210 RepID=A0A8J4YMT0_CHIOP|nr:hypothetical protein GWK47_035978 [Chionoecetes opilio]